MLAENQKLIEAGAACHWLQPRDKMPVNNGWASARRFSLDELKRHYTQDYNIGVRLGEPSKIEDLHLYAYDMDIRDPEWTAECHAEMDKILPLWRTYPSVISGSGGESRHIYFFSNGIFRTTKIVSNKGHRWEIDLRGTGGQIVLPPSIHPHTGQPYRWEREFDWDLIDMGVLPFVSAADVIEATAATVLTTAADDEDDLIGMLKSEPIEDLEITRVRADLESLHDFDWDDYHEWIRIGMALHHQFQAGDEGLELWCEYSQRFPEKFDRRATAYYYRKFKLAHKDPVTIRSVLARASAARALEEPEGGFDEQDDDDEDLIGLEPTAEELAGQEAADLELIGNAPEKPDAVSAGGGKPTDLHWEVLLDRAEGENGKTGAIKPTLTNFALIVKNDSRLRGVIGHNEFTHETVQIGKPGRKKAKNVILPTKQLDHSFWELVDPENGDLWSEERDLAVRDIIEAAKLQGGWGMKISDRDVRGAVRLAGTANSFHPIKNFLEAQTWDGVERIETMLIDFLGAPDNAYTREVSRLLLIAAVTRIYEPGHKFDYALILEGLQGARKTTLIETLGMAWFAELQGEFHDEKKMVEGMQGAWIMEIPELSQFVKGEVEPIKAFISRKADKVRLAYERRAVVFPRQVIFIGSTNNNEYLKDDTGGRRFWPMPCNVATIDTDKLRELMPQIWAEAKVAYDKMRVALPKPFALPLTITNPDALRISKTMQESRRVHNEADVWAARIQDWLDTPYLPGDGFDDAEPIKHDRVCGLQAWVECLGFRAEDFTNRSNHLKMTKALDKLVGFRRHPSGSIPAGKYNKQRSWVRDGSHLSK